MSRPLRLSSTMQLPTVTRQGAERQLQTQRDTQIGRRTDSGRVVAAMAVSTPLKGEQHDAAVPTVTAHGAKRPLERQPGTKSGRRLDSGNDDGDEYAAEVERHDATAHRDDTRSGEAPEEAARQADRREHRNGNDDGDEHAAEAEQHDAAVPTATTQGV